MYDFKGVGSTPRSAIPDLREYSHKSGIVPLGVLPDPINLCTGSGLDMICTSVIILPLDTLGALPETKNKYTGSTPRDKKYDYCEYYNIYYILCQDHSRKPKIRVLGVLPETKNKSTGSAPRVL